MPKLSTELHTYSDARLKALSMDQLITRVQSLSGSSLTAMYIRLCGEDHLLKVKNNADLLQRSILDHLQKQGYSRLSVRHYNMLYRLQEHDVPLQFKNKIAPPEGAIITRVWKYRTHKIMVMDGSYHYNDRVYSSLSQIAKEITGHERSGPAFFGLNKVAA